MLQVHFSFILCLAFYFAKFTNGESQCTDFNPCKNLAECLRRDDDFTRVRCVCKRGFNGNLCEIWPKVCSPDFCFNGGTCVMIKKIPRCLCQPEFKGLFCESHSLSFENPEVQTINPYDVSIRNTTKLTNFYGQDYQTFPTPNQPVLSVLPTQSVQSPPQINPPNFQNIFIKNMPQNNYEVPKPIAGSVSPSSTNPQIPSTLPPVPQTTFEYQTNLFDFNNQQQSETSTIGYFMGDNDPNKAKSICDFDPCLNFGNCIPLTNTNSLFKFKCICPENYAGILCENALTFNLQEATPPNVLGRLDIQETTKSIAQEPNPYSDMYFTEPIITTTTTASTTTTTTTTTQSTTTTVPTTTSSTTTTEKKNRKYSLCSQLRPCANNGQCIDTDKNNEGIQKFRCICRPEFTGVFCHIKVNRRANVCAYNLCLNSGECIPSRDNNSFTCVCPPNFTGKFCEIQSY